MMDLDLEDPKLAEKRDIKGSSLLPYKLYDKIWNGKHAGILCMVISSASYSVMGLLVKILTVLSGVGLWRMGYPFFGSPKVRKLVLLRAVFGFVALSTYFYSIQLLALRDATVLNFTMPVFTGVMAMIFLKERFNSSDIAGTLVSFIGVLFVVQPEALFNENELAKTNKRSIFIGTIMAMIGACTGALSYIIVRAIGKNGEPPLVSVFAYAIFSTPMAGICLLFQGVKIPNVGELITLNLVGGTAYLAQIFLTRGLQLEKASRATSIQYVKVLITYVLGVVFLGEIPSFMGAIGAVLIALSAYFISSRDQV